jgi:cyclopropane fatty-acyl-phospholipid synthase-like methyltransferase
VLDLGCGEGALIDMAINGGKITYIAGVDVDKGEVDMASYLCQPSEYDKRILREKPIDIELYTGRFMIVYYWALSIG